MCVSVCQHECSAVALKACTRTCEYLRRQQPASPLATSCKATCVLQVGIGMLVPPIIAWSMMLGAVVLNGIALPIAKGKVGDWYDAST